MHSIFKLSHYCSNINRVIARNVVPKQPRVLALGLDYCHWHPHDDSETYLGKLIPLEVQARLIKRLPVHNCDDESRKALTAPKPLDA